MPTPDVSSKPYARQGQRLREIRNTAHLYAKDVARAIPALDPARLSHLETGDICLKPTDVDLIGALARLYRVPPHEIFGLAIDALLGPEPSEASTWYQSYVASRRARLVWPAMREDLWILCVDCIEKVGILECVTRAILDLDRAWSAKDPLYSLARPTRKHVARMQLVLYLECVKDIQLGAVRPDDMVRQALAKAGFTALSVVGGVVRFAEEADAEAGMEEPDLEGADAPA